MLSRAEQGKGEKRSTDTYTEEGAERERRLEEERTRTVRERPCCVQREPALSRDANWAVHATIVLEWRGIRHPFDREEKAEDSGKILVMEPKVQIRILLPRICNAKSL